MPPTPFAPAFAAVPGGVPPYLELLNLGDPTACRAALAVIAACRADDDEIAALLAEDNWRPHLVACAAILLRRERSPALLEALWRRLAAWSWTSPQIAATLSLVDPEFVPRALRLLAQDTLPGKPTAALLGLLAELPGLAATTAALRESPGVARRLAQDLDNAPTIATGWRQAILALLPGPC